MQKYLDFRRIILSRIIKINNEDEINESIYNEEEFNKLFDDVNTLNLQNIHTLRFEDVIFDSFVVNKIIYKYNNKDKSKQTYLSLVFKNCTFLEDFIIDLEDNTNFIFNQIIIVNRGKKKELNNIKLGDFTINKLHLKNYTIKKTNLFNLDFGKDSKVLFENIVTDELVIKKISQDSKYIQFHNVKVNTKLLFERVEFKNTYFNDFNLKKASIRLIKTSFIDSHLNSVNWGLDISRIKAKKDILRQLKYVNDSVGNYIEGNRFFEQEMLVHQNDIRKDKSKRLEKLILCINKNISNFGQNWLLSFIWIIIVTFSILFIQKYIICGYSSLSIIDINLMTVFIVFITFIYIKDKDKKNSLSFTPLYIVILLFILMGFIFDNSLNSFSRILSIKPPEEEFLKVFWTLHKLFVAFPLYHFTISLRRLTRR